MALKIENIDWVRYMRLYMLNDQNLGDRFPVEWVTMQCRQAARLALAECPDAEPRMSNGKLDEEAFAVVVCGMVARVMRYSRFKTETSGTYSYTNADAQQNSPGYDASPNLYVSARDRTLLNGHADGHGPFGTIHMGLDRAYGM